MLMLDRRMLLRAGSAAVGAAALDPNTPALAHAPEAGKRAQPGFYRFKLGTIEITVISDGTLAFPAETLWGDRGADARRLLTSTFQPPSPVGLEINTILVDSGNKLVLIDAGCGVDKFQKMHKKFAPRRALGNRRRVAVVVLRHDAPAFERFANAGKSIWGSLNADREVCQSNPLTLLCVLLLPGHVPSIVSVRSSRMPKTVTSSSASACRWVDTSR